MFVNVSTTVLYQSDKNEPSHAGMGVELVLRISHPTLVGLYIQLILTIFRAPNAMTSSINISRVPKQRGFEGVRSRNPTKLLFPTSPNFWTGLTYRCSFLTQTYFLLETLFYFFTKLLEVCRGRSAGALKGLRMSPVSLLPKTFLLNCNPCRGMTLKQRHFRSYKIAHISI